MLPIDCKPEDILRTSKTDRGPADSFGTAHHTPQAEWKHWWYMVSYFREKEINGETPGYFRSIRITNQVTLLKCAT